ncbi:MAG: 50S ribosomal protein L25 [Eubacteriales bacterium]
MEEIILKTMLRTDTPKKVRLAGFIPGVLNESDLTSTSVQFVGTELNKIISKHGSNAKVWITIGDDKKFGFIKEVQKSPLDRKIIHIAIQLVNKDKEIKMLIPISFHGRDELEHRELLLQVIKTEIDVSGKAVLMPDVIIADVSAKELGDTVTAADLNISADIKNLDADDEIYAIVKAIKEVVEEEPEEEAAAEVIESVVTPV